MTPAGWPTFGKARSGATSSGRREVGVVFWGQRFYAFSNRCTHADFQLHFGFVEDDKIYCPIHYGEFNLETGKAQGGPWGIGDLPVYEARVEGEYVQVKLPVSQDLADGFGGRRTAVGRFLSRSTWPPGL